MDGSAQKLVLGVLALAGIGAAVALGSQDSATPDGPITIVAELPELDGSVAPGVPHAVALKRKRETEDGFGAMWTQFDADRDGLISKKEYSPDGRWNKRFDKRDTNGDGFFSPEERRRNDSAQTDGEGFRRYSRLSFEKHDTNGDGSIDGDEFPGPPEVFVVLDDDGDGLLGAEDVTEGKGQGKKHNKGKDGKKKGERGEKGQKAQSPEGGDAAPSEAPAEEPAAPAEPAPSEPVPAEPAPSEPNSQ